MRAYLALGGVTILVFLAPALAQDNSTSPNNGICVSGSLMLLKCCSPTTFTTCETINATCRAVPFNGACANNKLAMRFPAESKSYEYLHELGIMPTDLFGETQAGHPVGPIDSQEAKHMKARREARESIALAERAPKGKVMHSTTAPKSFNRGLGINGPQPTNQPPQPCQIVGNVVFSSCDYENAILDHFMGDDPCDYGC